MSHFSGFDPGYYAAKFGHTQILELLRRHSYDLTTVLDGDVTLLHIAADGDHRETAKLLIKYGVPQDAKDTHGFTPASRALRNGHRVLANMLERKEMSSILQVSDCLVKFRSGAYVDLKASD